MSYRSLVKSSVRKAFSAVKDLAVDVTLTRSTSDGFDFATLEADHTAVQIKYLKGIVIRKNRLNSDSTDTFKLQLLLKTEDVSDFTEFDTISIAGVTYKPQRPFEDNGYTLTIPIVKVA